VVSLLHLTRSSSSRSILNPGKSPIAHWYIATDLRIEIRWHEHDPLEIISSVEKCIDGAVAAFVEQGHSIDSIKSVGITNQRETTVLWNYDTGEPLYNAIVWTDTRTQALVRTLKKRLGADQLQDICGLPLSTYPSVGKLLWLLENEPKVKEAYEKGILAFGTIDAWLVYKLNDGPRKNVFVSDPTNASRTMFMNLETLEYDERLIDFFRLDRAKLHLPKITRSSDPKAYGTLSSGALKGFPITGCLGDQSAALVGQKGFTPGMAKSTYGTGSFLLYNVGEKPVISTHGLLSTVAYFFDEKPVYALEGSIAVAGSSIKFLVDNFGFIDASNQISQLAETVEDNGGCTFVTAFSGLFAPYWIDDARGTICKWDLSRFAHIEFELTLPPVGITAYTKRGHIARATLEATCFQTKAILEAMQKDSGRTLTELAVDGGMSNSDLTMQVSRPRFLHCHSSMLTRTRHRRT
jgi:glycerol kinase